MKEHNKDDRTNRDFFSTHKLGGLSLSFLLVAFAAVVFFATPILLSSKYSAIIKFALDPSAEETDETPKFVATHVETPNPLKGIYMTSWVAGTPSIRAGIIEMIENSELNAIVIDIKDDTGRISFDVWDKELDEIGSEEIRIADLREFIEELHSKPLTIW